MSDNNIKVKSKQIEMIKTMWKTFLPLIKYILGKIMVRITQDELLDEELAEICITILEKSVSLTRTKTDDVLLQLVVDGFRETVSEDAVSVGSYTDVSLSSTRE